MYSQTADSSREHITCPILLLDTIVICQCLESITVTQLHSVNFFFIHVEEMTSVQVMYKITNSKTDGKETKKRNKAQEKEKHLALLGVLFDKKEKKN